MKDSRAVTEFLAGLSERERTEALELRDEVCSA